MNESRNSPTNILCGRSRLTCSGFVSFSRLLDIRRNSPATEYNPRYFPDPYAYKPSRWYEQETSEIPDVFTAFSVGEFVPRVMRSRAELHCFLSSGPRACIGRKFAQVEAVCWLALLLRDWKVEPLLRPGETLEEWRERVLSAQLVMTLTVGPVPLRFVRRATQS